ncbi:MAG: hypothetical protein U9N06_04245 [candidate division WOR-3 bacterium]|nr:hypothetical protein [candidate division WOR-3 bacterium]
MINKRTRKNFYRALLGLLIFGCASRPAVRKLPQLVGDPTSIYPEALYLSEVGSGSSIEEAKKNAIYALSNIFSVDVSVDRTILEAYTEKRTGDKINVDHSINLLTRSALISENRLINVRTPKSFFDKKTGTFYVIAFINRQETEPIYLEEIKKNDRILINLYRSAQSTNNKLEKFTYLKNSIQIALIGEGLRSVHRIISGMNDTPPLAISEKNLEIELQDLSRKIVTRIRASGEYSRELSSFLREVVQKTGFSIGEENSDLTIEAQLNIKALDLPRNEKFVRWELRVDVQNSITGNTMKTFTRFGREGHLTLEAATNRVLLQMKKILMDEFYIEFNKFLIW